MIIFCQTHLKYVSFHSDCLEILTICRWFWTETYKICPNTSELRKTPIFPRDCRSYPPFVRSLYVVKYVQSLSLCVNGLGARNVLIIEDFDPLVILKVWPFSLSGTSYWSCKLRLFPCLRTVLWYRYFGARHNLPTFSYLPFSRSIILAKLQDKRRKIGRVPKGNATCTLRERWLHFCHCTRFIPSPFPLFHHLLPLLLFLLLFLPRLYHHSPTF